MQSLLSKKYMRYVAKAIPDITAIIHPKSHLNTSSTVICIFCQGIGSFSGLLKLVV
jgi:hypothetical protein